MRPGALRRAPDEPGTLARHVVGALLVMLAFTLLGACSTGHRSPISGAGATPGVPGARGADAFAQRFPGWKTDFSRALLPAGEFDDGGPGKDGIPAIEHPKFVPAAKAMFLDGREPVLSFELNGDVRAYPVEILVWHEIVDDVVAGQPILISYCPLCNSDVAFKRTINGTVYDFGVSGLLRNSDMVMFDRETETWWQQIAGQALVGSLSGAQLTRLPVETISFAEFRAAHPGGLVLSRDTGFTRDYGRNPYVSYDDPESGSSVFLYHGRVDHRLSVVERVVSLDLNGDAVAYPFSSLADHTVVDDTVGGTPVVVFYKKGTLSPLDRRTITDSKDVGSGVVFERTVGGRVLSFSADGDAFRDAETGSTWDIAGRATAGSLAGQDLPPVVHGNTFWFAWAAFQPDTRVWQP